MGDTGFIIREASQSDLESIAQIALTLYPNNFNGKDMNPRIASKVWVEDNLAPDLHAALLVADRAGRVIGYTHSHVTAHAAGVVAVDEWGAVKIEGIKGVGTGLIQETLSFWKENHFGRFGKPLTSMLVYTGFPGAGLCKKLGFYEAAQLKNLYSGLDEHIMRMDFLPHLG